MCRGDDVLNRKMYQQGARRCYTCTMCGKLVDLDDSISCRGVNLICASCAYRLSELLFNKPYSYGDIMLLLHKAGEEKLKEIEN